MIGITYCRWFHGIVVGLVGGGEGVCVKGCCMCSILG